MPDKKMMPDRLIDERTPVLVGCGQRVQKGGALEEAKSPLTLMSEAARLAAKDSGLGDRLRGEVDSVCVVRFIIDSPGVREFPFGRYTNPPATLARLTGTKPDRLFYGPTGGNSPQYLINAMADRIAEGEVNVALVGGGECFFSFMKAMGKGITLDWGDDPGGDCINLGVERDGVSTVERTHGLQFPVNAYPLFENGIRHHKKRKSEAHRFKLGELFAPFSEVAAHHPQAWFPVARSAEEIATPGPDNRYVGFPYTKYMNAVMQVDQAACVVMMAYGVAQALNIPKEKYVFLHGGAEANDIWHVTERVNYHSSPAIRTIGRKALDMAGWRIDDVDYFDIYSCFPSAVQIAREALGIADDDLRSLTVTGGLPYFGGAGNSYVMHSVATMMDRLRAKPGSRGICTANGWHLTKHAIGLYSTTPREGTWQREEASTYQAEIDNEPHPVAVDHPRGAARVETYTVVHNRNGPHIGLVIGRLEDGNGRFIAHTPSEPGMWSDMMTRDWFDLPGHVGAGEDGRNIFTPGGSA
ncbi:MAG: acetyl-CoA acetyltransferase [Parvularculales bacterium]